MCVFSKRVWKCVWPYFVAQQVASWVAVPRALPLLRSRRAVAGYVLGVIFGG